ncbi:MAG: glycosyltransferase family 2 protein [Desulfobacterales bacterium]|nr:glycosyltransferase family 2 protein [Desulfobacterales bacterium]
MISFSIITPTYNRKNIIYRCIKSIALQGYEGVEHIIIDDGSSDDTENEVLKLQKNFSKSDIKYIKLPQNLGVNRARNKGILCAKNNFVIFLDSDDYLKNNALFKINEYIEKNKGYLHYLFLTDDIEKNHAKNPIIKKKTYQLHFFDWLSGKISGDFVNVMEKNYLSKILFPDDLRIYEGVNFLRLFKASKKQLFIKEVIIIRERNREDSLSKEYIVNNKKALYTAYLYHKKSIEWFYFDYIHFNLKTILIKKINKAIRLSIAIGKYDESIIFIKKLSALNINTAIFKLITKLRLGEIVKYSIYLKNMLIKISLKTL